MGDSALGGVCWVSPFDLLLAHILWPVCHLAPNLKSTEVPARPGAGGGTMLMPRCPGEAKFKSKPQTSPQIEGNEERRKTLYGRVCPGPVLSLHLLTWAGQ